jgi:hypothetical protein
MENLNFKNTFEDYKRFCELLKVDPCDKRNLDAFYNRFDMGFWFDEILPLIDDDNN